MNVVPFDSRPAPAEAAQPLKSTVEAEAALTFGQLQMVALVLEVEPDDLKGISVDQLLAWLQEPPSEEERAALLARRAPAPAAPMKIPRELLATVAKTLNVPVRDLEGASPDTLLGWLDDPESYHQQRRAVKAQIDSEAAFFTGVPPATPLQTRASAPAPEAAPPAQPAEDAVPRDILKRIAKMLNVSVRDLQGATHEELLTWLDDPERFEEARRSRPAPEAPAVPTAADGLATMQERFRSVQRSPTNSRPGDAGTAWSPLLARPGSADGATGKESEAGTAGAETRVSRRSALNDLPDLRLIKGARAVQAAASAQPQGSLLASLGKSLGKLFKRSSPGQSKPKR